MSYLFDTCVLSEYVKKRPNEKVIQWLDEQDEATLFISILSLGEIRKGIIKIEKTQPQRHQKLTAWLQKVEVRFSKRTLILGKNTIKIWAIICGKTEAEGKKLPIIDSLIAATAYQYNLIIVTRNITDFQFSSVQVFSPWNLP